MRKMLGMAIVLAAMPIADVHAADLLVKAPPIPNVSYNWSGLYIGGFAGYGWGRRDVTNVNGNAPFPAGTVRNLNANGGLGGVQVGFNYEFPSSWLIGIEADFAWSHIAGTNAQFSSVPGFLAGERKARLSTEHFDMNSITTVTGRVGHAFNNWLLYAKGGGAWAGTKSNSNTTDPTTGLLESTTSDSRVRSGWTVGAGVEWGFSQNWSALLEYDFLDFGTMTNNVSPTYYNGATGLATLTRNSRLDASIIKVGLNYRFGLPH